MAEPFKNALLGEWTSIAPEVRPSKNADGSLRSFFLTRNFRYLEGDRFELTIMNLADPFGATPLCRILLKGHLFWRGDHPIAPGAQNEVRPLHVGFANLLNQTARNGHDEWSVEAPQSVFGKSFPPFGPAGGRELRGVRLDLPHARNAILGRPLRRQARVRHRGQPPYEPPDSPRSTLVAKLQSIFRCSLAKRSRALESYSRGLCS
jgi:hypothetical protein